MTMSIGKYITDLIKTNTTPCGRFINTREIIKALGFDIKIMKMREAGILTSYVASSANPTPERSTIALSDACSPERQKCVAAWLVANYFVGGNYSNDQKISVEVTEVTRWRDYNQCTAMFLATRLVIPEKIITEYNRPPEPGTQSFNGTAYAKAAKIEIGFLQASSGETRVSGFLEMLSNSVDLSTMSSAYVARKRA